MPIFKLRFPVNKGDGTSFPLSVRLWRPDNWEVAEPDGWCPMRGPWEASDAIGPQTTKCYGGGTRRPEIFRIFGFSPFNYDNKLAVGQSGDGRWVEPEMPVDRERPFRWELVEIIQN